LRACFLPPFSPARAGGFQSFLRESLDHHRVLELGDGADDLEEHAPCRGAGVDALVEDDEVRPCGAQLLGQLDQILQWSGRAGRAW
jgi:hypothetical protein